jgi:hypothetical protein
MKFMDGLALIQEWLIGKGYTPQTCIISNLHSCELSEASLPAGYEAANDSNFVTPLYAHNPLLRLITDDKQIKMWLMCTGGAITVLVRQATGLLDLKIDVVRFKSDHALNLSDPEFFKKLAVALKL